jgi:type I restriction enzyme S subunit
MTELGALPEEWEVVRLGEYCKVFSGYAFKSDDFCNNGVLVVKIGNLQNGSIVFNTKESFFPREKINDDISKYILNEGDILIALTGATTGKISLVPKSVNGALLNQRVGKFSIYNDSLYKSFVMYYVMTDEFQNHIKKNILQSAQGNISPKQIETFSIPLPPLPEQQKIAAVLSAVQEAKEKTEAVIAATKALKKSMMKHLFTYGPVSPEEAENVQLKETEIGPVPEDWEVVRLGEYCKVFSGYAFKSDDFCSNGVLVVKIGNLQNGSIVFNAKESFFPREKINDDISKFILKEGDILIALTGATTGKISLVPKSVNGALLNQRVGKFSIYNDSLYKSFVMYYFMTDEFQNNIKKNILQSAQGNISPKQIETFPIPLPPLPIQQKIASILSAIDAKIEAEENKKKALEELFKTLLDYLMSAKIRVNHLEVPS